MRLDKYLKVSRIIKRRTIANEACSQGKVYINDKPAKPSAEVQEGDIIELRFGEKGKRYRVTKVLEHVPKGDETTMYDEI